MTSAPWRVVLATGIVAALIAAALGHEAQVVTALLAFLAAGGAASFRLVRGEARAASLSRLWIAGAALFLMRHLLDGPLSSLPLGPISAGALGNAAGFAAYMCAIHGLLALGRAHRLDNDPTNRLDALIIAGNVAIAVMGWVVIPAIAQQEPSATAKLVTVVYSALDLALLFLYLRIAITPGTKGTPFWLVSLVPVAVLTGDQLTFITDAGLGFSGSAAMALLIPTIGFVAGAAAVMHGDPIGIVESDADGDQPPLELPVAHRFAMIAVAVAAPLAIVVTTTPGHSRWVILAWLGMLGLVMMRLMGFVGSHANGARVDRVVSAASARLAQAESVDELNKIALETAVTLAKAFDTDAVTTILTLDKRTWHEVATSRVTGEGWRNQSRIQSVLHTALGPDGAASTAARQINVAERAFLVVPLVSNESAPGAVVLDMQHRIPPQLAQAISDLAGNFAVNRELLAVSEELQRQRHNRRFRALIENSNDAYFIITASGQPLFTSSSAERMLRSSGQSANVFQAIHPQDRAAFVSMVKNAPQALRALEGQKSVECRVVTNGGPPRWIDATATDMTQDPDIGGVVVSAHDVTERRVLEADQRYRVLHDELTGIPNRALLRERADHALSMRRNDDSQAALLVIGLSGFKTITDSLGPQGVDDILKIIAFRLDNYVRGHDTAARLGRDEFAVLLQDVAADTDIDAVAKRLLNVVQRAVDFDSREVKLTARIGVCRAQPDYDSGMLLRNADVALQEAKHSTSHIAYFSESMTVSAVERLELRRDLERAIERGEIVVRYQAIIDLQEESVAGFEALVRWEHPERGLLSPGLFVPLAEESGLIMKVGAWVLGTACAQLADWRRMRPDLNLQMSINVSPRQLVHESYLELVENVINQSGIDAAALVFELTAIDELSAPVMRERLAQLRHIGVGVAADDFGGGFAAYAAHQELPFTVAKIDRSLMVGLDTNFQQTSRQLRSVIELAHSAHLKVSAEGIEDSRQRDLLTSMGCDLGQGYFFGRPVEPNEAQELLGRPDPIEESPVR